MLGMRSKKFMPTSYCACWACAVKSLCPPVTRLRQSLAEVYKRFLGSMLMANSLLLNLIASSWYAFRFISYQLYNLMR